MTSSHVVDPSLQVMPEHAVEPGEYELDHEQFKDLGHSALGTVLIKTPEPMLADKSEPIKTGEMETMEVNIVNLGQLAELLPNMKFKGKISVANRLKDGSASVEGMASADALIDDCYTPVTPGATVRCGDGREVEGYDESDPIFAELGPQVFGATVGVAQGRRLRQGDIQSANLKTDVKAAALATTPAFAPGGHTDVMHAAEGGLGCGAVASLEAKSDHYVDAGTNGSIRGVTKAALKLDGQSIPDNFGARLAESGAELKQCEDTYFEGKADVVDSLLEFNKLAKQVVAGNHKEYKVRLNYQRGTTFNPGKFNTLTKNNYQVFNVDVWYLIDQFGPEDAAYILADNLATAAELTDGSLTVEARLPVAA